MDNAERERLHKDLDERIKQVEGATSRGEKARAWVTAEERLAQSLGMSGGEIKGLTPSQNEPKNALFQGVNLTNRYGLGLFSFDPNTHRDLPKFLRFAKERLKWHSDIRGFEAIGVYEMGRGLTDVYYRADHPPEFLASLQELFPGVALVPVPPRPAPGAVWSGEHRRWEEPEDRVPEVIEHLQEAKNVILQGPPGSGKTWLTHEVLKRLGGGSGNGTRLGDYLRKHNNDKRLVLADDALVKAPVIWEVVQFHQGYTYDTFVRGLVAGGSGGVVQFQPQDGPLLHMTDVAARREGRPCLLVLEEITRCNLSAVLGDCIVAIEADKRGKTGVRLKLRPPEGGTTVLRVPQNLWLLGTVNTADKSVALVDYAIRRRFRFIDIDPDVHVLERHYGEGTERAKKVTELFERINELIPERSHWVGHGYLLVEKDATDWAVRLAERVLHEVMPLLREYQAAGYIREDEPELTVGGVTLRIEESPPLGIDDDHPLVRWLKTE